MSMVPTVYIFVRGGVVQGVRSDHPAAVHVIDYDEIEANAYPGMSHLDNERVQERERCGKTYEEIETSTEGVY